MREDHAHFIIQAGRERKKTRMVIRSFSHCRTFFQFRIKSYSAKEVNKLENANELSLWREERYDRYMRSDLDLEEKGFITRLPPRNPWAAGVVKESEPWPWLWTPDIEAWKPYVNDVREEGSFQATRLCRLATTPAGMGAATAALASADLKTGIHSHSAGAGCPAGRAGRPCHPNSG